MSMESIISTLPTTEERVKSFEQMGNVRDFGLVNGADLNETIEENSNFWRVPTTGELFSYFKEKKRLFSKFFKYKYYWAKNINSKTDIGKYVSVATSKKRKTLVLFR